MASDSKVVDVLVIGSGGAGLVAACAAAHGGARVAILERSPLFGGTTAISGGGLWIPNNHHMRAQGLEDSRAGALDYLERVSMGRTERKLLEQFVDRAPAMLEFLEGVSPLRFSIVSRPDYHAEWSGAKYGRALEPLPYDASELGEALATLRTSPTRAPVTFVESRAGVDAQVVSERRRKGVRTQGAALVAGLVKANLALGVTLINNARALTLLQDGQRVVGVAACTGGKSVEWRARRGVILATGGFEWNASLRQAFLKNDSAIPTTPPWADGDGLLMGLRAGALVNNMAEAWWSPAIAVPGEKYDGFPMHRNVVRELALPGSILVNRQGSRFVNEGSGYNDLGQAFHHFDPGRYEYPNVPAWLVFDAQFKSRNTVASIPPGVAAPSWFVCADDLEELGARAGISADGLRSTVARFNANAIRGRDPDFGRGEDAHSRFNGDGSHEPNPCLGAIASPPYYAVPIHPGNNGTKGGLTTDEVGRVMTCSGSGVDGLFAVGDVAASVMGLGYAGAGASLGPSMTFAYLAGRRCIA